MLPRPCATGPLCNLPTESESAHHAMSRPAQPPYIIDTGLVIHLRLRRDSLFFLPSSASSFLGDFLFAESYPFRHMPKKVDIGV